MLLTLGFEVVGLANVENFHKIEGATYWALGKLGSWQVTGYGERHDLTIFDRDPSIPFCHPLGFGPSHPSRRLIITYSYSGSIRYEYVRLLRVLLKT